MTINLGNATAGLYDSFTALPGYVAGAYTTYISPSVPQVVADYADDVAGVAAGFFVGQLSVVAAQRALQGNLEGVIKPAALALVYAVGANAVGVSPTLLAAATLGSAIAKLGNDYLNSRSSVSNQITVIQG